MPAYSFKKRFVEPIRVGLNLPPSVEAFAAGMDKFGNVTRPLPKRQTIRAIGKRRHARPGETLQLYTAMRTKQCEKIGEATCTEVVPIEIFVGRHDMVIRSGRDRITGDLVDAFARLDGFFNRVDMHAFWLKEHGLGEFKGVLIRWKPNDADGQSTKPRVWPSIHIT